MELTGRAGELATIHGLLQRLAGGGGGALLVRAEPGLGKSALLDHAVKAADALGVRTLVGRCEPYVVERLLAPVLDGLGLTADPADALLRPVVEQAGGTMARLLAERAIERIEDLSTSGPLLLVVDDLQHADAATLAFIDLLLPRAADHGIGLLGATRPTADAPMADVEVIGLDPLDAVQSLDLARSLLDAPPGPLLRASINSAAGSPLLIHAVVEAARGVGLVRSDNGLVDLPPGAPPLTAGPILGAVVGSLSDEDLALAQAAAVLGARTPRDDAAALAEAASFDGLAATGIVRLEGDDVAFRHPLYRAAVLDTLDVERARELHSRAAALLRGRQAPLLAVVEHEVQAAMPGDARAAAYLRSAAEEVAPVAPTAALTLLDRAAELTPEPDEATVVRLRALGGAGRQAELEHLASSLLLRPPAPHLEVDVRRELAFALYTQNRPAEALAVMDSLAGLVADGGERARALAESAFAAVTAADLDGAKARADEALAIGGANPAVESTARSVRSLIATFRDELDAACEEGRIAVERAAEPAGAEGRRFQPWFCAALALLEADRHDEAAAMVERGRHLASSTGAVWALAGYDGLDAFVAMRRGDLDDAAAAATAVLPCIGGTDGLRVGAWAYAFLAQVAIHRGQRGAAEELANAGAQLLARGEALLGADQVALAQARLLRLSGASAAAAELLQEAWDAFEAIGVHSPRHELGVELAGAYCAAGRPAAALPVADWLDEAARTTRLHSVRLFAAHSRMLISPSLSAARAVADLAHRCPRPMRAAAAWVDAAHILREAGDAKGASELLVRADAVFADAGADGDRAVVAPLLAGRSAPPRARVGWASLTRSERKVLTLLAKGAPNADIAQALGISRRTVECHVSSAYRKLGVRTRVELARMAAAHDD